MRVVIATCVVAACLSIVGVGAAQAFEWAIAGKSLEELKLKSESVSGKAGSTFEIAAQNGITVKCGQASTEGLVITSMSGGLEGGITLSSCTVPTAEKTCTVEPIKLKVVGQFAERNRETFVVFKGSSSELATLFFAGKFCLIPEEEPLAGMVAGKLGTGEGTERTIEFSATAAKGAEVSALKLGSSAASMSAGKLGLSLSGANKGKAWGAGGGAGLGPGTELEFSGDPVGTVRTIVVENVGLPLSTVTMRGEWVERSGLVDEGDFLIVPAGGAEACAMPVKKAKGVTFESLIGNGAKCKVGVEFISGITGVPGEAYVLEYGPYIFWPNIVKFPVKASP